jgi:hypothetical protein
MLTKEDLDQLSANQLDLLYVYVHERWAYHLSKAGYYKYLVGKEL